MFWIQWAISQVLSYEPWWWLLFIAIAGGLSYRLRIGGLVLSQFLIAALVGWLDFRYQAVHSAQMDMDVVFDFGVIARVLLINALLLPLSVVLVVRRRNLDRLTATVSQLPPSPEASN